MTRVVQYLHVISTVKVMAKLRNYNEKKLQNDVKKKYGTDQNKLRCGGSTSTEKL